jgi:hypothetical protein
MERANPQVGETKALAACARLSEESMKERPILMNALSVRAIMRLDKAQTRRVINQIAPEWELNPDMERIYAGTFKWDEHPWPWKMTNPHKRYDGRFGVFVQFQTHVDDYATSFYPCPYGNVSDRLWVRETWRVEPRCIRRNETSYLLDYRADPGCPTMAEVPADKASKYATDQKRGIKWRPSIFMPRWANRIMLEVTGVRVERVQDIAHKDVLAEGGPFGFSASSDEDFSALWDSINAKRGFPYSINPWVWAVEFKRI